MGDVLLHISDKCPRKDLTPEIKPPPYCACSALGARGKPELAGSAVFQTPATPTEPLNETLSAVTVVFPDLQMYFCYIFINLHGGHEDNLQLVIG